MELCPETDFKDPKDMLRHLKHCKLFPNGKFWCPTCQRVESFKVVSKKKCSWDRVNIARKLYQKSLKILQRVSGQAGMPRCYCDCHVSQNGALGNGLLTPLEPRMPPTESGHQFSVIGQSATATEYCEPYELPTPTMIPELSARNSNYMSNLGTPRHPSYNGLPVLQTPCHQVSPSELSSASLGRSAYSSDISPTPTNHTTDSPVLGRQFPADITVITPQPIPTPKEGSQVNRRGDVPLLTVDTRQSVSNSQLPPEWVLNRLLDEGETLGPPADMADLGMAGFTPIINSQPNEIFPFNHPSVPSGYLVPQTNMEVQPSPSTSVPSQSNSDTSPSSMSSGPDLLLQCHHVGCDFRPSGRIENLRAYMRKHLKNHQNNVIPCEHCDKTFTRQDNLTSHIRKVHPEIFKRPRDSLDGLGSSNLPKRKDTRREAQMVF